MSCVAAVRSKLQDQPGVTMVDINFEEKTATVSVDPEKFDAKVALKELTAVDQFKDSKVVER